MKLSRIVSLSVLSAIVAMAAFAFSAPAQAQEPGGDNDYVDVGLTLEVPELRLASRHQILDIIVVNHGSRTAYDVEVVVRVVYPKESSYFLAPGDYDQVGGAPSLEVLAPDRSVSQGDDRYSLEWSIPELGGLQRETLHAGVIHKYLSSDPIPFNKEAYPHEFEGEVTTSSFESKIHKGNNTSRVWSYSNDLLYKSQIQAGGNYTVTVSVDDLFPSPGDTVNFTITTSRDYSYPGGGDPVTPPIDLKADVELTDGLSVSGDPTYETNLGLRSVPEQVRYSNGVFNVGTLTTGVQTNSVTLPIRVSSNATVHEQCLTATLTGNPPPGNGPFDDDISDNVAKVCLGSAPVREGDQVVLRDGTVDLFTWYDCVEITNHPCSSSASLEIVALGGTAVAEAGEHDIIHPHSVVVHIPDPAGRAISSDSMSDAMVWSTGFEEIDRGPKGRPGIFLGDNLEHLDWETTNDNDQWGVPDATYPTYQVGDLKVEVSGPGEVSSWYHSSNVATSFYGSGTDGVIYDDIWYLGFRYDIWLEFATLGTYTVTQTIKAKYDDDTTDTTDPTEYTDSGTYTFHVGPMTDLSVADGSSSDAAANQTAYTILAANNGPEHSADARVQIALPSGAQVTEYVASEGTYSNGVWTLPGLKNPDYRRSQGKPEAATLTLILSDGGVPNEPATATITLTDDSYNVCIASDRRTLVHTTEAACVADTDNGGSWHEGTVYEYPVNNNTATIQARSGLAGGAPDTAPALVQAIATGPRAKMVTWSEPESGSNHPDHGPVRSWDIEYSEDEGVRWMPLAHHYNGFNDYRFFIDYEVPSGSMRQYRVRARYDQRVGDWTVQSVPGAQAAAAGDRGVTIRPTSLTLREGGRGSYSVRLDARPTGNVVIDLSHSNPDVRLTTNQLTFTPSNWSRAQTVYVNAARDQDTADETDTITHVIDQAATSADYDYFILPDVTVTVTDPDAAPRFTAGGSGRTEIHVDEGGSTEYQVVLRTRPSEDVTVTLSYPSGTITLSPVRNLTFTPENYNVPLTITVTALQDDDDVDNDLAFICHRYSGDYADEQCLPVTVTDDDRGGVSGEVELSLSGYCPGTWPDDMSGTSIVVENYPEQAGGCFYQLRLKAAPTGNVTVTLRTDASKVELDADLWTEGLQNRLTFTPENWQDAQEIGFWPKADDDAANNNDFTITQTVSGGGYNGVVVPDIVVKVVDADRDRIGFRVEAPHGGLEAGEGDRSTSDGDLYQAAFYMFPETQPASTVTVAMSSDNPDVTLSPSRLSFTRSNWDQGHDGGPGRRVIVRAAQDSDEEDETATITFTVTSSDADYNGMEIGALTVRVVDDDKSEDGGSAGQASASPPPHPVASIEASSSDGGSAASGTRQSTGEAPSHAAPVAALLRRRPAGSAMVHRSSGRRRG